MSSVRNRAGDIIVNIEGCEVKVLVKNDGDNYIFYPDTGIALFNDLISEHMQDKLDAAVLQEAKRRRENDE